MSKFAPMMIRAIAAVLFGFLSISISEPFASAQPDSKSKSPKERVESVKPAASRVIAAHNARVGSVQISPNGRYIVSGSDDKTMKVWDIATGTELFRTDPLSSPVRRVAFAPSGDQVVTCSASEKETIVVWDLASGRPIRGGGIKGANQDFSISPTAKSVIVTQQKANVGTPLELLNVELATFKVTHRMPQRKGENVRDVAMLAGKAQMLLACSDNRVRLTPTDGGLMIRKFEGHTGPVASVAVDAAGKLAISGSSDKTVRVWDVAKGTALQVLKAHDTPIEHIAMAADGSCCASIDKDGLTRVWDPASGSVKCSFLANAGGSTTSLDISPNGAVAVTGHPNGDICIWDLKNNGWLLRKCEPLSTEVHRVVWLTRVKSFLTIGSINHTIYHWAIPAGKTPKTVFEGHTARVLTLVATRDERWLLSAGDDRTIRVWDLETGKEVSRIGEHTKAIERLLFTADDKSLIAVHSDGTITVWDTSSGDKLHRLEGHTARIATIAVSENAKQLVSVDATNLMRIWDLTTGRELHKIQLRTAASELVLSPNGENLYVGSQVFYSMKTGLAHGPVEVQASADPWIKSLRKDTPAPPRSSGGSSGGSTTTWTTTYEYYEY